jgi:predicted NodU family carbamoyl transferase
MADVLFDCTQFLTFEATESGDGLSFLLASFGKNEDFKMLQDKEISERKLSHLNEFLNKYTVELVNQEFIGEFDEWFEMDEIPQPIKQFGQNIKELIERKLIEQLTIILVRYAYDERAADNIFVGDFPVENIYDGLYHASCFGNSGNIVVIRIRKS